MKENLEERVGEIDRRQFLKGAGIVGGAAGVAGYAVYRTTTDDEPPEIPETPTPTEEPPETPTATEEPPEERFDIVVDAVEAGAQPDGSEPINFLFEEYSQDSTAFVFESGTYEMEPFEIEDRRKVGIICSDDERSRFVPADGECRGGHPYVLFDDVADLVLEDIRFDFQNTDSGGPLHLFLEGDSTLRNVSYEGACSNQLGILRIEILDSGGSALVEGFETVNRRGDDSITGVYVGADHAGEITFRDCNIDEFSDNGLYASGPGGPSGGDGPVHVIGGTYRNNNISNVRLGSSDSTAEDVTVVVDSETPGWGQLNARGIRLRNRSGQVIRDCNITFEAGAADSFGAVVFHPANGGGTVRDTEIRLDRDNIPAVRAFPPETSPDGAPVFEDVSISGAAADGVITHIEGRDGTVFRNCTIDQPGRPGLFFRDSQDCLITDSTISVARTPIRAEGSTVTVENTTISTDSGEEHFEELHLEDESLTI